MTTIAPRPKSMSAVSPLPGARADSVGTRRPAVAVLAWVWLTASGCLSTHHLGLVDTPTVTSSLAGVAASGGDGSGGECPCAGDAVANGTAPPAELTKTTLPAYRIEPPDVLLLEGIRLAPKAPYKIGYQDLLQIVAANALEEQPIANVYQVDSSGFVDLGPSYGAVRVQGLTLEDATDAIVQHLSGMLQAPGVSVTLIEPAGQQLISGEHQVAPDGTIHLGIYGSVFVTGMTVDEARRSIESHLSEYFEEPSVSVEVFSYQSKVYYVIIEGPQEGVVSLPITGNETVLDAIADIGSLGPLSNKRIWISRPAPLGVGCDQVLPVDWIAITKGADTGTNYQLLPGDRVFIAASRCELADAFVARVISPVERIFGFSLLGAQTFQSFQRFPLGSFN